MAGFIIFPRDNDYIEKDNVPFSITKKEQNKGLMWQRKPSHMVFLYKEPAYHKFWMKNTVIPLDILFVDSNWKIREIKHGVPYDESLILSNILSKCVIESPYGFCKKNGIYLNDRIKLKYDKKILKRMNEAWS